MRSCNKRRRAKTIPVRLLADDHKRMLKIIDGKRIRTLADVVTALLDERDARGN